MKTWLSQLAFAAIAAFTFLNVNSSWADSQGDNRFSVTVGSKDQLVIFSPSGEKVAELNAPAIAQQVKVGASTFQVSYGRDVNDLWTAILAPSPSAPSALHFTALDNKIDADKTSVVTLTFSKDVKKVTVDPGYIGVVKLNDARVTSAVAVTPASAVPLPKPVAPVAVAPRPEEPAPAPAPVAPPAPVVTKTEVTTTEVAKTEAAAPATTTSSETTTAAAPKLVPQLKPDKAFWAEPVTPPNPKDLPVVATDEIKLLEVHGTVTVTAPNSSVPVQATSGQTIPSGSVVKTGPDGSAAALLGGVNSARLMPDSEGTINQSVSNNKRDTLIDLKNGVVFANVGRKPGETQDFKVKTPAGVAAAKGTAFVVKAEGNHLFVATLNGQVITTDNMGNFIGNSTGTNGTPGVVNSDPAASASQNSAILGSILAVANAFNDKINALEAKDPTTLTQEEKNYLANAPKIAEAAANMINEALKTQGFQGNLPPQLQQMIDSGVIPSAPDIEGPGPRPGNAPQDNPLQPAPPVPDNSPVNFNPNAIIGSTTPT